MSSEGKSEVRGRRFLRRSDQAALALLLVVAIASLGIRWFRAGGPTGHLVNADERLAANLSPRAVRFVVDINTADVAELGELPQVGPMLARRLIEHRERNGRFRSFDDLLQVKGIGRKTLEVLRPHVRFD
ncbi:MAG: helix-hairpin-helix domain-containing protein [Planctomycetia bacterium]|nr:helix-hairpin-helix domain-containing protein [Planctomycetia bacterium]